MATRIKVAGTGVWIPVSESIPEPYDFFAGTETSKQVLVTYKNGDQGVDWVHYPHGAFGGSREPNFVARHYSKDPLDVVEYWLDYDIPATPEED
jgi:hypothetical protein